MTPEILEKFKADLEQALRELRRTEKQIQQYRFTQAHLEMDIEYYERSIKENLYV